MTMSNDNKIIKPPDEKELWEARDKFYALLKESTKEADYQKLFTECPYILSRTLPFKLESSNIIPFGRHGKDEPDFVFFSKEYSIPPVAGVIELKRPDKPIVSRYGKNIVTYSSDALKAIEQIGRYEKNLGKYIKPRDDYIYFLGNEKYSIAIMGLSRDLASKMTRELYNDFMERFYRTVPIIPYDAILRQYERGLPSKISLLVPDMPNERILLCDLIAEIESDFHHKIHHVYITYWDYIEARLSEIFKQEIMDFIPHFSSRLPPKFKYMDYVNEVEKTLDFIYENSEDIRIKLVMFDILDKIRLMKKVRQKVKEKRHWIKNNGQTI